MDILSKPVKINYVNQNGYLHFFTCRNLLLINLWILWKSSEIQSGSPIFLSSDRQGTGVYWGAYFRHNSFEYVLRKQVSEKYVSPFLPKKFL